MIIVTGANGQLGRMVAERLLEAVPAEEIGVSVRDVAAARDLGARGVRVRRGDFADPDTLPHAFEGASKVLIVSTSTTGEAAVRGHRTAVAAAAAAGAERILYTSHMGASPSSRFAPMPDHAATEEALRQSGVPFTSLRNGFYVSSAVELVRGALETGVLAVPEDGPVAWTAHADLADAAVLALTGEVLDGLSPALTGPEVIDMAGIAEILTRLTGRPIRRVVVSDDEYRARLVTHGVPEPSAEMLVGLFAASREGDFAPVDPTLADVLGRPVVRVEDYLKSAVTTPR
ncbi:NAD(P)H-binding protein [Streptomyces sp. DASNCL29]|uniref:NmrA family NAD(P)-binding protein n=1 Tax=Streptomyces sp. DASNCL29 TaxID=2583819 RepID=UPI00110FF216|nr:NAD(P)H-binding protein [Streptomyces sp. DASNCL29]TMU90339.1 SDR family NAD(P)-dependent oxidoreductase [Streptomyces sp. DASNCL29]